MSNTALKPDSSETSAARLSRAAQLLLARLLLTSGKKGPTAAAVRKSIDPLLPQPLSAEAFEELRRQLLREGWIEDKMLRLTEAGQAAAMEFLGIDALAARTTWKVLLDKYLFPLAAGIGPDEAATRKRIATASNLLSFVIRKHYQLKAPETATVAKVLDALVFKELGFPEVADWATLRLTVLSRLIGSGDEVLKGPEIQKQLPRIIYGLPSAKPDEIRKTVIRRWIAGDKAPVQTTPAIADRHEPLPARPSPIFLPTWAATVKRIAHLCTSGKFGENKVFIGHVWRKYAEKATAPPLDLREFKERLVEANREGLVRLSRADLVAAMDGADVRESEARYLNAEFHFVLLEGAEP